MPASDSVTPEPRRFPILLPRPLSIGVAAGVLIVTGLGLRIGIPIYRQHMAIQEIEQAGWLVLTKPAGPNWLRALIGDEPMRGFDNVYRVHSRGADANETTLNLLSQLPALEELYVDDSAVTATGLMHLKRLDRLQAISLVDGRITDTGLACLCELPNVRALDLTRTPIGDAEIAHLKGATTLRYLDVGGTQVTDAGVAELQRALPGLKIEK